DDLMGQDMSGMQTGQMRADLQQAITQLGLDYRLLTQFTSFVAIEEMITTDSSAPRRVDVPVEAPASAEAPPTPALNTASSVTVGSGNGIGGGGGASGGLSETVTVTANAASVVNTTSADMSTTIESRAIADLPLNGRNIQTLALLAPGVTAATSGQTVMPAQAQASVNGQRPRSNSFVIDGVSANVGIAPGGTRLGGPVRRDRLFFFAAYEGLRLRQPAVALTDVPSLAARRAAPANVSPFFNAFPLPTGSARADGFAEAAASYANPARHDAFSFRLDKRINDRLMITGRHDYAASSATTRGDDLFSLNTLNARHERTQTLTASAEYMLSARTVAELRGNFSRYAARSAYRLDDFGGAVLPATASFFTAPDVFSIFDLNGRNAALATGGESQSLQRQFQLLGALTTLRGAHAIKFGADYRRLFPV